MHAVLPYLTLLGSGKNAILYKLQNMGYSGAFLQGRTFCLQISELQPILQAICSGMLCECELAHENALQQAKVETRDNPQFRFEVNRQFCNKINDSILKAEDEYKARASPFRCF